ncbi:MAG: pitrilysin family protein [Bacteroidota bacterium]
MKYLVVLVVALTSAVIAQEERLTAPFESFTLVNGLRVILHEDHTTPMISVNMLYHVGSAREKSGRTGLAHLFEHIMFEGSANVPEGKFDGWLEAAGGENNGGTTPDNTRYWQDVPSNALELALFLESDRMGHLLPVLSQGKVDGQRDVVKNERRQSYENQPYGMDHFVISENLYPADHPYHWPTIGSMDDLTAASYEDIVEFFKAYYGPNNASLCLAGDFDPDEARGLIEKWFGDVPAGAPVGPINPPPASLTGERRLVLQDAVQLPRLYMVWHSPALYAPGDAEMDILASVLSDGRNSRLYKRLIYDLQIAQDVSAFQASSHLGSSFWIVVTARAGHALDEIERIVLEEIDLLGNTPPSQCEVDRAVHQYEADFLVRMEQIGGFYGKADLMNMYYYHTGDPDYFEEDLARYQVVEPPDVRAAVRRYLLVDGRLVLSVVPDGQKNLASGDGREVTPR